MSLHTKVSEQMIDKILDQAETSHALFWGKELVVSYKIYNGFTLLGRSATVDPANFDIHLGFQYAREDAKRQLWMHMGFLLQERLHRTGEVTVEVMHGRTLMGTRAFIDKLVSPNLATGKVFLPKGEAVEATWETPLWTDNWSTPPDLHSVELPLKYTGLEQLSSVPSDLDIVEWVCKPSMNEIAMEQRPSFWPDYLNDVINGEPDSFSNLYQRSDGSEHDEASTVNKEYRCTE